MSDHQSAVSEVASSVSAAASKITYGAAGTGVIGWLMSVDIITWIGVIIAFGSFVTNWYYRWKDNKRADELHAIKMREGQCKGNCNAKK